MTVVTYFRQLFVGLCMLHRNGCISMALALGQQILCSPSLPVGSKGEWRMSALLGLPSALVKHCGNAASFPVESP